MTARGMDGENCGLERGDRFYRLCDGVRDVVEFQVEENRETKIGNPANAVRTVCGEELQAELYSAGVIANGTGDLHRPREVRRIQGHVDRTQTVGSVSPGAVSV